MVCALLAALALLPAGAKGEVAPPLGEPLLLTTQSPIQKLRFAYLHEGTALPGAGGLEASVWGTWGNVWDYEPGKFRLDGEYWYVSAMARYGLLERLAVSLQVPYLHLGGGVMDPMIEGFHNTFNLGNMDREKFPRDQLRAERYRPDGRTEVFLDGSDTGWHRRAPVVALQAGLTAPEAAWPVVVKVAVPLGRFEHRVNENVRGDLHGGAVAVSVSHRTGPLFRGTASLARVISAKVPFASSAELTEQQTSLMLAGAWRVAAGTALIAQLVSETPLGEETDTGFDRAYTDLSMGLQWQTAAGWRWEAAMIENLFEHTNNTDFAVHAGVTVPVL